MYGRMYCMGSEQQEEWGTRYIYLIGVGGATVSDENVEQHKMPQFCSENFVMLSRAIIYQTHPTFLYCMQVTKIWVGLWEWGYSWHVSIFHVTYWIWRVTVTRQLSEQVPKVVWTVHVAVVLKCCVRHVTKISEVPERCHAGSILGGTQLSYVTCTTRALTSWCIWEGKQRGLRYKAYGW